MAFEIVDEWCHEPVLQPRSASDKEQCEATTGERIRATARAMDLDTLLKKIREARLVDDKVDECPVDEEEDFFCLPDAADRVNLTHVGEPILLMWKS